MFRQPRYRKDYLLYCNHCQQVLTSDEMHDNEVYCTECLKGLDSDKDKPGETILPSLPIK